MCGPIAMMLPVDRTNQAKKTLQILTYHLGRLSAYGTIGFLFGLLGKGFSIAGIQQELSIFLGVAMITIVVVPERFFMNYNFSRPIFRVISKIKTSLGSQFKNKSYQSLFTIGVLNGFLPCGMVYVALFGAIAMQSAGFGVLYMILFGLGTVPMMSSVVYLNSILTLSVRNKIQKIIPYVGVCIGILFILRGLGLGIPYVSPNNMSLFVQAAPNCHK
jgi:hypothetical protein